MKTTKQAILALVTVFLFFNLNAQNQWSSHHLSDDFSPIVFGPTYNGSYTGYLNDFKVFPDAITSNEGNDNSVFAANSIFTIYSPRVNAFGLDGTTYQWIDFVNIGVGAWLIAKDPSGNTTLSRKITLEDYFLNVMSVRYKSDVDNELLVFTGSIISYAENDPGWATPESRMVVGSYNLKTNAVDIEVVDQYFDNFVVASQGIGVEPIKGYSEYIAIGNTANDDNSFTPYETIPGYNGATHLNNTNWPISVIFDVSNTGVVSVEHVQTEDFIFKPHSISESFLAAPSNDPAVAVGGVRVLDEPVELCQGSCQTLVAPGVYTFEANYNGSNWSINVNNGTYLLTDEYEITGSGAESPNIDILLNETTKEKEVVLAVENFKDEFLVYQLDISLTTGVISLLDQAYYEMKNPDVIHADFDKIIDNSNDDGGNSFDLVFSCDDYALSIDNEDRFYIGFFDLSFDDISINTDFTAIYNDGNFIPFGSNNTINTFIRNTTGFNIKENSMKYIIADGYKRPTDYSRAHFNGSSTGTFDCQNIGTVTLYQPTVQEVIEDDFTIKDNPSYIDLSIFSEEVSQTIWNCSQYPTEPSGRIKSPTDEGNTFDQTANNEFKPVNPEDKIEFIGVFNIAGQEMNVSYSNSLMLNNLKSGIYILRFKLNGVFKSQKVVVNSF